MKRLVEFPLEGGGSLIAEVRIDPDAGGGLVPAGKIEDFTEQATSTFEAALEGVRPVVEAIISKIHGIATTPSKVSVELAFKLNAKSGLILVALDTEANFKIVLEWNRPKS
jgi:hypothetical protein